MEPAVTRQQALTLLRKYNREPFHLQHALTVEGVMRWYARELGYNAEENFWGLAEDALIHAVCSHGYGLVCNVEPAHEMEKVLFAADELTGLIGAAVRMRPSKSVADLEVSSLKKKFKDKKFAAGCSRDVIRTGSERLGWELERLFQMTIEAMRSCEAQVQEELTGMLA